MFTLEETENAVSYSPVHECFYVLDETYIHLSRPHNETREYWTKGGVTQHAQGNKMNTDNLIPISYVKKFTPLAVGDVIFGGSLKKEYTLSEDGADNSNRNSHYDDYHLISFADRPNTGKQPVKDEHAPMLNCTRVDGHASFLPTSWKLNLHGGRSIKSWKPNHAAMLKQYQQEQGMSNKEQAHHIALQIEELGDGPKIDWQAIHDCGASKCWAAAGEMGGIDGLPPRCDAVIDLSKVGDEMVIVDEDGTVNYSKPVFTQAMADAGELPPVGSKVLAKLENQPWFEFTPQYFGDKYVVGWYYINQREASFAIIALKFKPIKTEEDKLREALMCTFGEGSIVTTLMNSDKFTIKLKG